MKPLIDLTGRKLKLGDIIISGGTVSGMNRYLNFYLSDASFRN